mmetsp:Transcript_19913/g.30339  ORF Transcript_19913/g.30339 Transcript_19913/m.30339 type:complete len:404 (-) Transcript_19913:249-1460(-)
MDPPAAYDYLSISKLQKSSEMTATKGGRSRRLERTFHFIIIYTILSFFVAVYLGGGDHKRVQTNRNNKILPHVEDSSKLSCRIQFKDPGVSICNYRPSYGGLNFGDELGQAVVDRILERYFSSSQSSCHVATAKHHLTLEDSNRTQGKRCFFAVGSIFHYTQPGDIIWGIGMKMEPNKRNVISSPFVDLDIYAVRGPKTNAALPAKYAKSINMTFGDPGFLLPTLFPELLLHQSPGNDTNATMDTESLEFCFVYHAKDAGRIYQHFANQDNSEENSNKVLLIDPLQPWQDILKILQTCKRVAASSLHGIILADSMGIPSLWFQFAQGKYSSYSEGYFKYQDYFLSIGREGANKMAPIVDTNQVFDISRYSAPLPTQDREAIANRLLASFPYNEFVKTKTRSSD